MEKPWRIHEPERGALLRQLRPNRRAEQCFALRMAGLEKEIKSININFPYVP
jgi:hypothetical protein